MDRMSWEGISLVSVVLGFVGAVLGVSYMPPMSKKQLAAALVAGVVCAALAPGFASEAIAWWREKPVVPLPGAFNNVLAFVCGIGGMFIVPTVIVLFKSAHDNPMGFLDWIRGRGAAPPAAHIPEPGDEKGAQP